MSERIEKMIAMMATAVLFVLVVVVLLFGAIAVYFEMQAMTAVAP